MAADTMPIVALYVRVSTGYQVDKDSLPYQKKELRSYCRHVLHMEESRLQIFEDAGKSAKNTRRPAFERMMQAVREGRVSHVLVYKIDRISRNLVDFSIMYDAFKKHRVTFISLNEQFDTSSAIGEAILKIILVFAELERKMTSERVTDIMLGRASMGLWNGAHVPYGYKWDPEQELPVPDERESPMVKFMYDYYEKHKSTIKLRDYLIEHGYPTKRGGDWTYGTVVRILRNPIYKGTYRYNYREANGRMKPESEWIVREDIFTPIVSAEQWECCNAILDANAMAKNNQAHSSKQKYTHVFSGLLRCGICGSNMVSEKDTKRANGFRPSYYRCGNVYRKNTCRPKYAKDISLGPFVFNYIRNMVQATQRAADIQTPEALEKLLLSGPEFEDIAGIDRTGLSRAFDLMKTSSRTAVYRPLPLESAPLNPESDAKSAMLSEEKERNLKALERLKRLYLFDESAMSEKEYLETKQALEVRNVQIDNELAEICSEDTTDAIGEAFLASASSFLLAHSINHSEHIDYREFALIVGDEALQDFVRSVIDHIVILDAQVDSITFKNGMVHKFIRKEAE